MEYFYNKNISHRSLRKLIKAFSEKEPKPAKNRTQQKMRTKVEITQKMTFVVESKVDIAVDESDISNQKKDTASELNDDMSGNKQLREDVHDCFNLLESLNRKMLQYDANDRLLTQIIDKMPQTVVNAVDSMASNKPAKKQCNLSDFEPSVVDDSNDAPNGYLSPEKLVESHESHKWQQDAGAKTGPEDTFDLMSKPFTRQSTFKRKISTINVPFLPEQVLEQTTAHHNAQLNERGPDIHMVCTEKNLFESSLSDF